MSKESSENDKRKRNNLLSQYYGITEEKDVDNLFDVDGKHFNADAFVDKLVQVIFLFIKITTKSYYECFFPRKPV